MHFENYCTKSLYIGVLILLTHSIITQWRPSKSLKNAPQHSIILNGGGIEKHLIISVKKDLKRLQSAVFSTQLNNLFDSWKSNVPELLCQN